MNATQFLERFRLLTEVVSSYEAPGISDAEVCDLLNIAQREITLELCAAKKFDTLYSLIVQEGIQLSSSGYLGGDTLRVYTGNVTGNYYFPISVQTALSRVAMNSSGFIPSYQTSNTIVYAEQISPEQGLKFVQSNLNLNTIFLAPKYWVQGTENGNNTATLTVVLDSLSTIGNFTDLNNQPNAVFRYIKYPQNIDTVGGTTSNLPESLHELVLKRAVEARNAALVSNANKN